MLAEAGLPIPPGLEETIVVTLFLTPADVAVTSTLNVQLPPAGMVPPPKATAKAYGPTLGAPPQVFDTDGDTATINPSGNGSANVTRVSGVAGLGFVNVNVSVVVAPCGIDGAPNALVSVGGASTGAAITVTDAVAGTLVPNSVAATVTELFLTPAVVPVTFTVRLQLLPDPPSVPLASETLPLPGVAVTVPPQLFDKPFGDATTSPDARVSVNATPVAVSTFVFSSEIVSVVVPPTAI